MGPPRGKEGGQVPASQQSPGFADELWLLHPGSGGGHRQVARARDHFDSLGDLRIFFGQHLDRADGAVRGSGQLEPNLLLDKRAIAIEPWRECFPVRIAGHIVLEGAEYEIIHGIVSRLQIMTKFNSTIDLVFLQSRDATIRYVTGKEEERITQSALEIGRHLRLDHVVGGYSTTAIDGSTWIGVTCRPGRLTLCVPGPQRTAAINLVTETAVCII